MTDQIRCDGFAPQSPHDLEATEDNFAKWARDAKPGAARRCRSCDKARRAANTSGRTINIPKFSAAVSADRVNDDDAARSHEYIADPELIQLWQSLVTGTIEHGDPAANLLFLGPSGSGKTDGAAYLAALAGLPFTKVDAASHPDPEAWFGTREVVSENGTSVTKYQPSRMVHAIQNPGVLFVDEFNRVDDEHRNVWLPLTDGTGRVTNPLNGDVLQRHPHCFVIMAGNRGMQFTGTNAIDPAWMTRALTVEFEYIKEADEKRIVVEATGATPSDAAVFVRFANETRQKAQHDPDFTPISTREVIAAARRTARGLSRDLAAKFAIINAASPEGGAASQRQELQNIWNGVRTLAEEVLTPETAAPVLWVCPTHGVARTIPAGTSSKTGKPYNAFRACTVFGCDTTEDRNSVGATARMTCTSCGTLAPTGRNTLCNICGSVLA